MKTEELIKLIKEKQYFDIEDEKLEEVVEVLSYEDTNPRRDYLGKRTYYLNKIDNKMFFVEIVQYTHGPSFYDVGEAKVETKKVYTPKK